MCWDMPAWHWGGAQIGRIQCLGYSFSVRCWEKRLGDDVCSLCSEEIRKAIEEYKGK